MDVEVDHYAILGLPSGVEGSKLSEQEINKAYRSKARELHPDKRPDDPNAHADFLKLQTSYEVLKDEKTRKLFDDLLRVKQERLQRLGQRDSKRQRMTADLEERERASSSFAVDPGQRGREKEERIAQQLKEEIAKIRATMSGKKADDPVASFEDETRSNKKSGAGGGGGLPDKDRVLKVSWEKIGQEYTAQKLQEIFEEFGPVEDVVISSKKRRGSALVVMGYKDAASAATGNVLGDLRNPLLVLPYRTASSSPVVPTAERSEADGPKLGNLVGAGYHAFEESVLEKLKKAAQRQK